MTGDSPDDIPTASDLCVIDGRQLKRLDDSIREKKQQSDPIFWPVLLLLRPEQQNGRPILRNDAVDDVVNIPIQPASLEARIENLLTRRRMSRDLSDYNRNLQAKVERRTREIESREQEIVMRLASASKHRDEETGGHIRRLALYAECMAEELGWDQQRQSNLRLAAMMHDVGKIGIPDDILLKPGDLTDDEFETMQDHTVIGAELMEGSDIELLGLAETVARYHHEQWDGSGYPEGLSGDSIPEPARIVAVVDVYDALVHDRVYRDAMPENKVLDIIREDSGSHFEPRMVDCFFEILPSIRAVRQLNSEQLVDAV
jgi:putative two-component system response regulator